MTVTQITADRRKCDFIADISQKKELRLLQLTDMQIIDLTATRNPTRDRQIKGAYFKEGVPSMDERCICYVKELIEREAFPAPTVELDKSVTDFYSFTPDSFKVTNYIHGEKVGRFPVAI